MPSGKKRMELAERRKIVAANLQAGHSVRTIADALGVGKSTIQRDKDAILAEWQERNVELVNETFVLDLERISTLQRGVWDAARGGDLNAIATWLRLLERRARMLGYDSAVDLNLNLSGKTEVSGTVGVEMAGVIASLNNVPDDELDGLIANLQIAVASSPIGEAATTDRSSTGIVEGEYSIVENSNALT